MLYLLNKESNSGILSSLIQKSKSNSGVSGSQLRRIHYLQGKMLARYHFSCPCSKERYVIIALLRAGMPFATGLADQLDCTFLFFDPKILTTELFIDRYRPFFVDGRTIMLVDSVINTGHTIKEIARMLQNNTNSKVYIAVNVINEKAVTLFNEFDVYAIRSSDNSFVGDNSIQVQTGNVGPDTGSRLFRTFTDSKGEKG